jgi:hypothetical protein
VTSLTIIIFIIVYLGMGLGRLPWLAIDRTGVALLGLIALLAAEELSLTEAAKAIDIPTISTAHTGGAQSAALAGRCHLCHRRAFSHLDQ